MVNIHLILLESEGVFRNVRSKGCGNHQEGGLLWAQLRRDKNQVSIIMYYHLL